jgi:hypothetical protein
VKVSKLGFGCEFASFELVFLQLVDNENLRERKRRLGFLFKSSEL